MKSKTYILPNTVLQRKDTSLWNAFQCYNWRGCSWAKKHRELLESSNPAVKTPSTGKSNSLKNEQKKQPCSHNIIL
jgi:hypothetical protein